MPGRSEVFEVPEEHRKRIRIVRAEIAKRIAKSRQTQSEFFGNVIRRAEDEIFSMGVRRYSVTQLDTQEKIYVGKRVEILVRDRLDVARGQHADALIAGIETDFKYSMSCEWMIGPETVGTVCLGLGLIDNFHFRVGFFVPTKEALRSGENRDDKLSLKSAFRKQCVEWMVEREQLPQNFFATLSEEIRSDILEQPTAQLRLRRLAELVPRRAIPRSVIQFVSLGKDDALRRIREDKSLKSPPLGDMVSLSKFNRKALESLGIPLKKDEFCFVDRRDLP